MILWFSSSPSPSLAFSLKINKWNLEGRKGGREERALTGVAELVGCCPAKVTSSIPCQGTCLPCRFCPQSGHVREATNRCFSLTSVFLSLSFSLPFPLSKNKYIKFKRKRKETHSDIWAGAKRINIELEGISQIYLFFTSTVKLKRPASFLKKTEFLWSFLTK